MSSKLGPVLAFADAAIVSRRVRAIKSGRDRPSENPPRRLGDLRRTAPYTSRAQNPWRGELSSWLSAFVFRLHIWFAPA